MHENTEFRAEKVFLIKAFRRVFNFFDGCLKNEQTKETETYVLLLTDSQ